MTRSTAEPLELVGIGSMVLDRMHRTHRLLSANEKGLLLAVDAAADDAENDAAELGGPMRACIGGLMLNQLGWAALFGVRVGIFGRQADDEAGRLLRAAMATSEIETDLDLTANASSMAEIFVDDAGERAIYMASGATAQTRPSHVAEHTDFVARARRLSTEISQLPLDTTLAALELAHAKGLSTVVDLDVLPSDAIVGLGDRATLDAVLREADLLKPTSTAARELFPEIDDLLALSRRLREVYGTKTLLMTDGERGSILSSADTECWVPAYDVARVVDSTGAGDAFLGGYLAGEALGLGALDAAKLGNACGAACVERVGAFPDEPEVLRARVLEFYDGVQPTDERWGRWAKAGANSGAGAREGEIRMKTESVPGAAGRRVLEVAGRELASLAERHDGVSLQRAAELIEASEAAGGRVHVTGVGKPEHVAHYGASLLSSTGTPATFLHATESLHGSLGQIVPGDVVIAISNSGTTSECLLAVQAIEEYGGRLIAITGGLDSPLSRSAEVTLDAGVKEEGGPLGLAPRASVAAEILILAALGAVLQDRRGLDPAAYAKRHPAGALGKQARGE